MLTFSNRWGSIDTSRPTILVGFLIGNEREAATYMARKIKKTTKTESLRDKSAASQAKAAKPRKLKSATDKALKPVGKIARVGKKEVYLPLPDNKAGRFLNKRRHVIPSYFRESWTELRQVTWPNRKQTVQLTLAVFVFAIVFAVFVGVIDFGLDKIFRKVLLG